MELIACTFFVTIFVHINELAQFKIKERRKETCYLFYLPSFINPNSDVSLSSVLSKSAIK